MTGSSRHDGPLSGRGNSYSLPRRIAEGAELVIDRGCTLAAVVAAAGMTVMLTLNTGLRYIAGSGIFWSGDIVALIFPWMVMAGAVLAFRRNYHISVDIAVDLLPERVAMMLQRGVQLLVAATCLYVVSSSALILKVTSSQSFSTLGLPLSYAYCALPIGFFLIALIAVRNAVFPPAPEKEWVEAAENTVQIETPRDIGAAS